MKKYCTLILLLLTVFNLNAEGLIRGRVHNAKNNEPIPFANIVIKGTNIGTSSDENGNFMLKNVKPGFTQLIVSVVGFEDYVSEDFMITKAKSVYIDIPLEETSIEISGVEIRANAFRRLIESPLSLRTLNISEIEQSPGGNRDISKIITVLPGVASTVAYRNDVIVRGGGSNENKFYLDDIEIPMINHFATQGASGGSNGILNVDFLREVDFYSAAFPIHAGNALSSVLNFKMIEANEDQTNMKFTIGASDIAFAINTPLTGRSSLLFSVRRSYLQYIFSAIGLPFLPTYNDLQFKYKLKLNQNNEISIIGIGALDDLKLNLDIKDPDESQRYILGYLPVNKQKSYTLGVKYRNYKKYGYNQLILSNSYFKIQAIKFQDNIEIPPNLILDYSSAEAETKFRFEHVSERNRIKLKYGFGIESGRYTNETYAKKFVNNSSELDEYETSLNIFKWNIFAQFSQSVNNKKFTYSLGLRMDANSYATTMNKLYKQFSPRIAFNYRLAKDVFANFSAGLYYQQPSYTILGYKGSFDDYVNKDNGMKYIRNKQVVAGFEYLPDLDSKFTIEGFYKQYSNYPFSVQDSISLANKGGDYGVVGTEEVLSTGKGRAYGFEIYYRNKNLIGFNISCSYTYVRSEFQRSLRKYIPSAWDNRHLLNIVLLKKLNRNWDIGIKWRYAGGAPYTPYDLETSSKRPAWDVLNQGYLDYSRFNSLRFNDFHQLDLRVDKKYFFNKWTLMFYLDIQNIYNKKADQQDFLTNLDENGVPQIVDPNLPYDEQKYLLRAIRRESASIFPTIGIIVEF